MDQSTSIEMRSSTANGVIPTVVRNEGRSYEKQLAVHLILTSILFLFPACYLLAHSLQSCLQNNSTLNWNSTHASTAVYIFDVIGLIFTFVFAILSDSKLGKAKMITIGLPMFLIGFILMTIITSGQTPLCRFDKINNQTEGSIFQEPCAYQILLALIITAVSAGAVVPNLLAFGADQTRESIVTSRYFDKLIVVLHIVNILVKLAETFIGDHQGYFNSYVIATSMLSFAVLLFFLGWRYYIHVKPYDSVMINCIPVVMNAFHSWRQYKKNNVPIVLNVDMEDSITTDERPSSFLDFARTIYHGKFPDRIVDDVKLFRNTWIIFIIVLPYWFVSRQFYSTFVEQGTHMAQGNVNVKPNSITVIFLGEQIMTIIGVVVLNMFVYKYLQARNRTLTTANKFMISMCSAFITMCISGGIEILRQDQCPRNQTISNLSVYAQLLQDVGISLRQLFGLLATYEFAYFTAPRSAQSLFMSFCLLPIVMPDVLFATLTGPEFNCPIKGIIWHSVTYFFILAGVELIFIIVFLVCQKYYHMMQLNRQ